MLTILAVIITFPVQATYEQEFCGQIIRLQETVPFAEYVQLPQKKGFIKFED